MEPVPAAPPAPTIARVQSIPAAGLSEILGLLEILKETEEIINVFDLSARIAKEFGETIAIVKAAEMLDLVDTPKDDVRMTEVGWYFLAAPLPARKTLFKQSIMKLRLFQILLEQLEQAPEHRVSADDVLERLAALLPYEHSDKLFETLVAWGRYAEVLDYDQDTHTVYLPHHEEEEDDESEAF
jgi:NitT/TauT family transport system ATP-binding protein